MNQAVDENSWRTPAFRSNVVQKIEEAIQKSGMPTSKTSGEMENHVYLKANTKDEYLSFVARLILHVREMNSNKRGGQMVGQPQQPVGPPTQDPMNALRAMAHQGGNNQMMNLIPQQGNQQMHATSLLQTLNQRPSLQANRVGMQPGVMGQMGPMGPVIQGQIPGGPMPNQVNISMANQMNTSVNSPVANVTITGPGQMVNANSMSGPMAGAGGMPNQMAMSGQMGNSMSGPLPGQMGNVMNSPMGQQVPSPMPNGMAPGQMNVPGQMNHLGGPRKMVPDGMMMPGQGNVPNVAYIQSRCPVPNQFIRQNTPPPQPSPVGMNPVGGMVPSPALVPSPNTAQMPTPSGMVNTMMRQSGPGMAPSPNSNINLNTPGNLSQPTPSPCSNDEQAYRDKVKQLSRYIEPLRKMISRLGNGDSEKMGKMKKLLEILSSPGQRITMETLLKCEVVLEKLDIKINQPETQLKEQHPLIEAISAALQSPNPNHTLQRTFEPIMSTLNGKPLKNLPRPLKRKHIEEPSTDIPEVLQGEVARLDNRFKVSLDPVQQNSSKAVHLTCWLDDRHLPCIPPVQITIPADYPASSPKCNMSDYEYGATSFLQMIQDALQARISKLPARFTVSQLLDSWEMSVRETCSADRISEVGMTPLLITS
ncbi:mediator of RNA polymerase II transcription subunit 15-like [Planococcus citri]|uniref:mediator of RNA polymerase II transcription subunit 15-like n=1 Tax=Planococcus citri TaxID=170843 RepID=UPI0031F85398